MIHGEHMEGIITGFESAITSIFLAGILIICALIIAGAMVWLIWVGDLWMFYLFALVFGFAYGGMGPVMAALVGETFGLGRMGATLGMVDIGFSAGAAIGPAIGGLIFDVRNSYSLAFLIGALALLVLVLLTVLVRQETGRGNSGQ